MLSIDIKIQHKNEKKKKKKKKKRRRKKKEEEEERNNMKTYLMHIFISIHIQ
jgi:hypothetical protein